jgi:hypothetical protein
MIGLSTASYDPNGALRVPARFQRPWQASRRGSVTATLDGESAVYDGGFSISDQTLTAEWHRPPKAALEQLRYLVAYYAQLTVTCEVGAYAGLLSFSLHRTVLTLTVRLVRRLD